MIMKKIALIICNVSSLDEILPLVKQHQPDYYQILEPLTGVLPLGDPRMNNAIWPGYSDLVLVKGSESSVLELRKSIETYNLNCPSDEEKVVFESWNVD